MSLDDLATSLRAQASKSGQVTLNGAALSGAGLAPGNLDASLARAFMLAAGQGFTLQIAPATIPAPTAAGLVLSGTATVLRVTAVAVTATITSDATVTIVCTLPASWRFQDSFTYLGGRLFDALSLSSPAFVFTTANQNAYPWAGGTLTLTPGLIFAASLDLGRFGALTSALAPVIGTSQSRLLSGPIDPGTISTGGAAPVLYPSMTLRAPLGSGAFDLQHLHVGAPALVLTIGTGPDQRISLLFEVMLTVGSGATAVSLPFQCSYATGGTAVALGLVPDASRPVSLGDVVALAAGANVAGAVPPILADVFKTVTLVGFLANVDLARRTVRHLSFAVGAQPFSIDSAFKLEGLTLRFNVMDPFGARQTSSFFTATMQFFPSVFPGAFSLEATANASGSLSVSGTYTGTVALKDMVSAISGGTVQIPSEIPAITFTSFALSFVKSKAAYSWSLDVGADVTSPLPFFDASADAAIDARVQRSSDGALTYALHGGVALAGANFTFSLALGGAAAVLEAQWAATSATLLDPTLGLGSSTALPYPVPSGLLPDLDLTQAAVSLDFTNKVYTLAGVSKLGMVFFHAERLSTGWAYAVGAALADVGRLQLPDPLGSFLGSVTLQNVFFVASAVDRPGFTLPGSPPLWSAPIDLKRGLTIAAEVDFGDGGDLTRALSHVIDDGRLLVSATVAKSGAQTQAKLTGTFRLLGQGPFTATLSIANGHKILGLALPDISVTAVLSLLVKAVDPNFAFSLDDPWSALGNFTLSGVVLTLDATSKTMGFEVDKTIPLLPGVTVSNFKVTYQKGKSISVTGSIDVAGLTSVPLQWDAVNQPPPAVPSAAPKLLDVRYLGLGQHVSLTSTADLTTVESAIAALRNIPVAQDPTSSLVDLKFDAGAGWLIGFDLSIKEAIAIAVIFNDPVLYGLRIGLDGDLVGKLAGLSFEILYRKLADGLGLYHVDLALPTYMRHLEFGEVSITLPHIVVDVYTNGDFLVDFGFPYHGDFSQSMMIEAFPFTGAGGFYFGVLDARVPGLVPAPQAGMVFAGTFQPVIAFGFGLQVGIGKTFDEGPLSAGVLVSVEGIVEGVLAFWKWDSAPPAGFPSSETYLKLAGTVTISAHVWGSIDFVIVSASIDIYVFASVQLLIESHQPIFLEISAGVSVEASARVCGLFTIHFSFSTTVHESFTIGSETDAPWDPAHQLKAA